MSKNKVIIGLFEVHDPYEPSELLGLFENLESLIKASNSVKWANKKPVIYSLLCQKEDETIYVDIEGKSPNLHVSKHSFGPQFYTEELVVGQISNPDSE